MADDAKLTPAPDAAQAAAEANGHSPDEPVEANDRLPDEAPPRRPPYTRGQRLMALGFAILVVIITLMYTYSIATGDLFFR